MILMAIQDEPILPLGEGVTQGIECMEGSAMYFMSTFSQSIKCMFSKERKRQDSCKRMRKRLNLLTGMFHSHTLNDLSSDVDTNRRFLKNECILFNIV